MPGFENGSRKETSETESRQKGETRCAQGREQGRQDRAPKAWDSRDFPTTRIFPATRVFQ
jgi:hypothetical protein